MASDSVELRITALERRVEQLETAAARGGGGPGTGRAAGNEALRLLTRMRQHAHATGPDATTSEASSGAEVSDAAEVSGAITYAGAAGFGRREYQWAMEHRVHDLAAADWGAAASTLESLGSPARLTLLAALLGAPRTRTQLQEVLGESSTGHLYHHLRVLQAAGLLAQPRRGEYELTAQAVIPLLTIIAATVDLGIGDDLPPAEEDQ